MGQLQQQKPESPDEMSDMEVNNAVNPRPPLSTHRDVPLIARSEPRPRPVQRRTPLLGPVPTSYAAPSVETKSAVSAGQKVCDPHWLKQITNRAHVAISSALGQSVRRFDDLTPPGLRNPGQNVCFLNAIIQVIARTPCLPEAVVQLRKQNPTDHLVWYFGELLEQMTTPTSMSVPLVLDTSRFRMQASLEFAGGLIQHPSQPYQQRQQDAAECLTWLIEWLHSRMNSVSSRGTATSSGI